jgi:predicted nucleic acid-binding protein
VRRAILDTSVLIGAEAPGDLEGAISAASIAELHFGVLVARDTDERARRAQRLGVIEATFDPVPIDAPVAREWGRLAAAVAERGGRPRRRTMDLVIAATANVAGVPLLTHDDADFKIIADLVSLGAAGRRTPARTRASHPG